MKKILVCLPIFILSMLIGYFGCKFFFDSNPVVSGTIFYDETLTEEEKSFISSKIPENFSPKSDITISATILNAPSHEENYLLYDIFVPVADFYDERSDISIDTYPLLNSNSVTIGALDEKTSLIRFSELTPEKKLLSVDKKYFLDTLDSGAYFRYITLSGEELEDLKNELTATFPTFPAKSDILSLTQTGVTALARGMNRKISEVNDSKFFVDSTLSDFMSNKDHVHTSNESSFSSYASSSNICSDSRMLDALLAINVDIVELTGNHNTDCGAEDAISTLKIYKNNNIKYYGGGRNITEASIPLELSSKNTNITMIAFNHSTGGMTYGETPGANPYEEEKIAKNITEAKAKGNYVIVDIQFNECDAYANETENTTCDYADSSAPRDGYTQSAFFKHFIDLGADMVIGTSAHQPQTYELYGEGVIYYGLGNLFFDQIWWPDTTRSLILTSYFYNNKKLQTRLTGTIYNSEMQTRLMTEEEQRYFIARLNSAR